METHKRTNPINILLVEDNPADIGLVKEVMKYGKVKHILNVVMNGEDAMLYLKKEGEYTHAKTPDLIILDLNLPRKDGRAVLSEIKGDDMLKSIPVIVHTTSASDNDVATAYASHANCYVKKSIDLKEYYKVIGLIEDFWINTVILPSKVTKGSH